MIKLIKIYTAKAVKLCICSAAFLMFFPVFAHSSIGQELSKTKVLFETNNSTLIEIFESFEKQTPYRFVYDDQITNVKTTYNYDVGEISLKKALELLSEENHLEIMLENRSISVIKKVVKKDIKTPQKILQGFVTDENGNPLPGATILIKGSTNGTTTDFDGNFSLDVNEGDILEISYIGYNSVEILYSNQESIEINLVLSATELDDVVLIGYGSVSKKELTGSAANAENIENRAVTKVEEALQGNVSGVTVVSNGGDPTSTPIVKIRGVGTTSPESPLWVVDGVPYYGGPLNPFDIESITVLKDAAAASIYGVRAAGGVILVQTKQGKSGKITVDFGIFTGAQNVWNKPVALNAKQYTDAYNLAMTILQPRLNYLTL